MTNLQVAKPSTSTYQLPDPEYTFKRPYRQCFSLPYPVIKYMIRNPQSWKVWKKLIKSCKYFYTRCPVVPVESLKFYDVEELECKADGEIVDYCKTFPKLWVYGSFIAMGSDISRLLTKIFKADLCNLCLTGPSLTFHDYQKLTSSDSIEKLRLYGCTIKNADETIVAVDKLLENLNFLKEFIHYPRSYMFQPVKKMVQNLNKFGSMRCVVLYGIEETFDFSSFVDFLMKNETAYISLNFSDPVSAAYKEMIGSVIKEIKKNPLLKVPVIRFYD